MKRPARIFLTQKTLMFHRIHKGNALERFDELRENGHAPRTDMPHVASERKCSAGGVIVKGFQKNGVGTIAHGILRSARDGCKKERCGNIGAAEPAEKQGKRIPPRKNKMIPRFLLRIDTIAKIRVEPGEGRPVHRLPMQPHASQAGQEQQPGKEKRTDKSGGESEEWKSDARIGR